MKPSKVEATIGAIWLMTLAASVFLAAAGFRQTAIAVNLVSWVALAVSIGVQIHNMKD